MRTSLVPCSYGSGPSSVQGTNPDQPRLYVPLPRNKRPFLAPRAGTQDSNSLKRMSSSAHTSTHRRGIEPLESRLLTGHLAAIPRRYPGGEKQQTRRWASRHMWIGWPSAALTVLQELQAGYCFRRTAYDVASACISHCSSCPLRHKRGTPVRVCCCCCCRCCFDSLYQATLPSSTPTSFPGLPQGCREDRLLARLFFRRSSRPHR